MAQEKQRPPKSNLGKSKVAKSDVAKSNVAKSKAVTGGEQGDQAKKEVKGMGAAVSLQPGKQPPMPEKKAGATRKPVNFAKQTSKQNEQRDAPDMGAKSEAAFQGEPQPPRTGGNLAKGAGSPPLHTPLKHNDEDHDDATDRRRAAPARRRFAANDDVPSIGGLIFALQQRPSNRPFVVAGFASAIWIALSAALVWSVFRPMFTEITNIAQFFQSMPAMSTLAIVTIPIALFWFLALLIWRAQELRLMSSAMTEVAVRLAEPDKAAEQSVASLGQSVRRQVTAMNDAISRALGRAGELEAMVHNEVAALERSYSENEHRIRNLIGELAHERAALTNDGERLSSALSGIGSKLNKQIEHQGRQTSTLLEKTSKNIATSLIESSDKVTQAMSEQSNSVVSTMNSMNERVGREMPILLDRMDKEQVKLGKVVEHANKNLSALDSSIGHHAGALNNALINRTQQIEGIFRKHVQTMGSTMDERSQSLDNSLGNKLQTFDNTLHQRMDDFDEALTNTTQKIDHALATKAQYLDRAISSRVAELDSALVERTKVIDVAFTERLQALDTALHSSSKTLDQAFANRAAELGRSMDARSQYIVQTIGAKTKELDNALMSGAKTLQLTTEDVGKKVMSTIHGLAGQAQLLKDMSQSMQGHVSHLTKNLRDQSNFVMQAAAQLETSHDRIGSKLGSSHNNLQKLVDSIAVRTSDLDNVMTSYSNQLEATLSIAESKAREITEGLHSQSATKSMEALNELTKLRDAATNQTERAIHDMKERITAVSNDMSSQITTLSSEISDTQNHLKSQLQQIPDTTRKSASLMRRTLQDQLKALESLSTLSSGSDHVDISSPRNMLGGGLAAGDTGQFGSTLPPSSLGDFGKTSLDFGGNVAAQRQNERDQEIDRITENLAKRAVNEKSSLVDELMRVEARHDPAKSSHWSMGDLLARASEDEAGRAQNVGAAPLNADGGVQPGVGQAAPININAIAQLVEHSVALDLWRCYRSGLRPPSSETVYNDKGAAFRQISSLYSRDAAFRDNVDRYLLDFERILAEAEITDPAGNLATKHLTSDAGRVYLMLMHAAGRISG